MGRCLLAALWPDSIQLVLGGIGKRVGDRERPAEGYRRSGWVIGEHRRVTGSSPEVARKWSEETGNDRK